VLDWATVSSLATAGGTLVLAIATFASVRSANRAARAAERSLLEGLRPVLMPSRLQDDPQKVYFQDRHFVVPGGSGIAEPDGNVVYLALSVRNAGSGIAVLHGWWFSPDRLAGGDYANHAPVAEFRRLTRDIYIPAGDVGFWEGAFRDPSEDAYKAARRAIEARDSVTIEVLYGDHEGGQRTITRFILNPREDSGWLAVQTQHWNLDRPDPR
jgi:hypothetical protein